MPVHALTRARRAAAALAVLLAACSEATAPRPEPGEPLTRDQKWRADLAQLATELPRQHPNAFFQLPRPQFDRSVARLDSLVPALSDPEVTVGMMEIVAQLGDAHTGFTNALPRLQRYPLGVNWLSDGLFVSSAPEAHRGLLRGRVVRLGPVSADSAFALVRRLVPHENEHWARTSSRTYLITAEALQWVGAVPRGGRLTVEVEHPSGARYAAELDAQPWSSSAQLVVALEEARYPLYLQRWNENYWFQRLPDGRTLYVRYNLCSEAAGLPFATFAARVLAEMDARPVDRVVFDLRGNTGGSMSIAQPLIAELGRRAAERKVPFLGLTDARTFSAGMINAVDVRRAGGTLLGEPTGGKPNSYMTAIGSIGLAHSGLVVRHSTGFFRTTPLSETPTVAPDVLVPLSSADYFAGRDPVLERALQAR